MFRFWRGALALGSAELKQQQVTLLLTNKSLGQRLGQSLQTQTFWEKALSISIIPAPKRRASARRWGFTSRLLSNANRAAVFQTSFLCLFHPHALLLPPAADF